MLTRALSLLSICSPAFVAAVRNGLARTPQVGWNNWNSLGCDVSESPLLETSRKLIDYGLKDLGFKYVVLDDCWQDPAGRDSNRKILVDQQKFPNGKKYVAEQLHSQGLLDGMYSSAGEITCARYEGSLDYETEAAENYASWDVDYLKYDNCYHKGRFRYPEVSFNRSNVMAEALKKAAVKSPLLIGTGLRKLNSKAPSILTNPAVIAVNQDPLGAVAHLVRRRLDVRKDPEFGEGEAHIWSGPLYPNDQLVVFLNGEAEDLEMTSTLKEIFMHNHAGHCEQTRQKWDVYDLWANRMEESVAEQIIKADSAALTAQLANGWYNSTQKSYLDGLK